MNDLECDFIEYDNEDKSLGNIHYKNGMKYIGKLKNDMPFGKGIICNEKGNKIFEGHWMNGQPYGKCQFYDENGDIKCECNEEEMCGNIKLYDVNGDLLCIKY